MPRIEDIERFAFVVGAPRCGTTSLAHFLKSHPDVAFPIVKEPHFFAQNDVRRLSEPDLRSKIEEEYLARFHPAADGTRPLAADCSVSYLYTAEQLQPALELWPESRFIVILRDPLEMLPSLHRRLVYLGDETICDFGQAWSATPARAAGRLIPRSCVDPRWLRYDEACRYGTYLEKLFAAVGRERCLVMIFDDLASDPLGQYRRMMDFLSLTPVEERVDFAPRRKSHDVRYLWLQRIFQRPPKMFRKYIAGPRHRLRDRKLGGDISDSPMIDRIFSVRKRVMRWNRLEPRKHSVSPALQGQIRDVLEEEVERAGMLIGRDLGHWLAADARSKQDADSKPVRTFAYPLEKTLEAADA